MKNTTKHKQFRVGLLFKNGETVGESFNTRPEADEYILSQSNIKEARILNRQTNETEIIKDL